MPNPHRIDFEDTTPTPPQCEGLEDLLSTVVSVLLTDPDVLPKEVREAIELAGYRSYAGAEIDWLQSNYGSFEVDDLPGIWLWERLRSHKDILPFFRHEPTNPADYPQALPFDPQNSHGGV